jgi:diaminopimelate epimerase
MCQRQKTTIKFVKMHAIGNDFVIVDECYSDNGTNSLNKLLSKSSESEFLEGDSEHRSGAYSGVRARSNRIDEPKTDSDELRKKSNKEYVQQLADRHKGIGFDQLLIMKKSSTASVLMEVYNADGSVATACGNGACCVAWLCMNKTQKQHVTIQTANRVLQAQRISNNVISVNLGVPEFNTELTKQLQNEINATFVSIGNNHIVVESQDDYQSILPSVKKFFPDGVNIEWLRVVDQSHISVRIFERGVGFTRACGTGACAAAVVAIVKGYCLTNIRVSMEEGDVDVTFNEGIILRGHVDFVFDGKIDYIPSYIV